MLKIFNNKKFLLLLLLVYLIDPVAIFMLVQGITLPDFRSYYAAGAVLDNGTLYSPSLLAEAALGLGETSRVYPYLYPPLLAHIIKPLSALPPVAASAVFLIINSIFLLLLIGLCYRFIVKRYFQGEGSLWLMAVVLLCLPLHGNLQMGQINIFVLTALVLALIMAEVRPLISGVIFNVAVLIKMTPVGFLALLFVQRRFLLLAQWLLMGLALLAVMVLLETGNWLEFYSFVKQAAIAPPKVLASDVATFGFSWRVTLERIIESDLAVLLMRLLGLLLGAVLLLPLAWRMLANAENLWLLYLPFSIVMVLASPITYTHHVIYLLPGALAWAYYLRTTAGPWALGNFISLLWVCGIDFPLWLTVLPDEPEWLRSLNFLALAVLFLFTVYFLWKDQDDLSH